MCIQIKALYKYLSLLSNDDELLLVLMINVDLVILEDVCSTTRVMSITQQYVARRYGVFQAFGLLFSTNRRSLSRLSEKFLVPYPNLTNVLSIWNTRPGMIMILSSLLNLSAKPSASEQRSFNQPFIWTVVTVPLLGRTQPKISLCSLKNASATSRLFITI